MEMDQPQLAVMNSWLRRWFQEHYEFKVLAKQLKKSARDLRGKVVLDAGCGAGYSCELILHTYAPAALYGIDLLPAEVAVAQKRGLPAQISVGDITATEFPSSMFDAVFAFGLFHHVPQWALALQEVYRLLKPDGILLGGEIGRERASGFTWAQFARDLETAGFAVLESRKIYFGYFYSFVCVRL